jgi:hypothetical protein
MPGVAVRAVASMPLRFLSGSRWRGPRFIPACQSRRRGRERNRALAALAPASQDLFPGRVPRPSEPASPAQFLPFARWKTSLPPGPSGCPPALLRLRSLRRRNTPRTRTPPPGTHQRKRARHGRHHHLPLRDHHLREALLRRSHDRGGVRLHGRLRPGLPPLRGPGPRVDGRHHARTRAYQRSSHRRSTGSLAAISSPLS